MLNLTYAVPQAHRHYKVSWDGMLFHILNQMIGQHLKCYHDRTHFQLNVIVRNEMGTKGAALAKLLLYF